MAMTNSWLAGWLASWLADWLAGMVGNANQRWQSQVIWISIYSPRSSRRKSSCFTRQRLLHTLLTPRTLVRSAQYLTLVVGKLASWQLVVGKLVGNANQRWRSQMTSRSIYSVHSSHRKSVCFYTKKGTTSHSPFCFFTVMLKMHIFFLCVSLMFLFVKL